MGLDRAVSRACFVRDGWKCRHCSNRLALHPHHVVYKSHRGSDILNNLLTLCWQCHSAHHEGKLSIEVLEVLENDLVVRFTRLKGWKPT